MNDRWLAALILVAVAFVVARAYYLPEQQAIVHYNREVSVSTVPFDPPLAGLWDAASREIPFSNESATLHTLHLDIAANGSVESIDLTFSARHGDVPWFEVAAVSPDGKVQLASEEMKLPEGVPFPEGPHPLEYLTAADAICFRDFAPTERGYTLFTSRWSGEKTYDDTFGNIYALGNGTLVPLREVAFGADAMWYTLEINPRPERVELPGERAESVVPNEVNPRAYIIFAERDLAVAERVLYAGGADGG